MINLFRNTDGGTQSNIAAIIGGVLTLVIGLVLANTVVSQAASVPASIGSFSGASALNDLVPLVYYAVIVLLGVGMMGMGASGFYRENR